MHACVVAVLLAASTSRAATPAERAATVLSAQLSVVTDPRALVATLAPDAVILGNGSVALARGPEAEAIAATLVGDVPVMSASIARLDASGTNDAVWLTADVTLLRSGPRGRRGAWATSERIVELIAHRGASWQVVAFAFASSTRKQAASAVLPVPGGGPLASWLASPGVYRDEWKDRTARVAGALEVHGDGWGFALGDVTIDRDAHAWWKDAHRVCALVIGVPKRGANWQVVALHVAE
jgi:hypothetical protein